MKDVLEKASEYRIRYGLLGRAHYLAAARLSRLNRLLGVPVIVITAVVGTTIFATLDRSPEPQWKILAGLVSLLGAVLSALQTSLGFAQTAERHKAVGTRYRAVRRRLELFELKYSNGIDEGRDKALPNWNS